MITEYIDLFREKKEELKVEFMKNPPESYSDICKRTLEFMFEGYEEYDKPDYTNIRVIDDGDYQGTIVFIMPTDTYQPYEYYVIKVGYGSCSGCDTFQGNEVWNREESSEEELIEEADGNILMALHMIESMKKI